MNTAPGALGLLWLWATVADLRPGGEPEPAARPTAEALDAAGARETSTETQLSRDHDFGGVIAPPKS